MQPGSVAYTTSKGVFYHPPRASHSVACTSPLPPPRNAVAPRLDPSGATPAAAQAVNTGDHTRGSAYTGRGTAYAAPSVALPTSYLPATAYSPLGQYLLRQSQPTYVPQLSVWPSRTSPQPTAVEVRASVEHVVNASTPRGENAFCCWLCGVPCMDGPGSWAVATDGALTAPALFYGPNGSASEKMAAHGAAPRTPHEASACACDETRAWWLRYRLWVSSLTLCDICGHAASVDTRATSEEVMQRARHTSTLTQRRTSFVSAVREYKLLQTLIADRVVKAAQRFHATAAARSRVVPGEEKTTVATMTAATPLWEAPAAVRTKVLHQLTQVLEDILASDEAVTQQPPRDSRAHALTVPFTAAERHLFLEELAHIERQAQRMEKGEYVRLRAMANSRAQSPSMQGPTAAAASRIADLDLAEEDFAGAAPEVVPTPAAQSQGPPTDSATKTQTRSAATRSPRPAPATASVPPPAADALRERVENTFWAAHTHRSLPREGSAEDGGVRTPRRAASASVTSPHAAPPDTTPEAESPSETHSLLARYFDGSAPSLPAQVHLLTREAALTAAVADTTPHSVATLRGDLAGQSSLPTVDDLILPREGSPTRNQPGELALYPPEATTAEGLLRALQSAQTDGAGGAARASERAEQLTRAVTAYVGRNVAARLASEDALLTAHGKVAGLMKSANTMAESLLTHSLSFTFRAHLEAMEALLTTRLNMMQSYSLQKSMLFAEEMTTLVRLAQRRAYRLTLPTDRTQRAQSDDAIERRPDNQRGIAGAVAAVVPTASTAPQPSPGVSRRKNTAPFAQASAPSHTGGLTSGTRSPSVTRAHEWENFLEPERPAGVDYQDWESSDADDAVDERYLTHTRPFQ